MKKFLLGFTTGFIIHKLLNKKTQVEIPDTSDLWKQIENNLKEIRQTLSVI